ncbi:MAG: amidohydrolase family protein [Planctomycetes bacterium]|nr:amidohydrolase family protein [Planctomycetota bacterium]
MAIDLVLRAAFVIPVAAPPIHDGWIAVADGRIVDLGRGPAPPAERVVDHGRAAIMPAFVNAHTHLGCAFLRGEVADLAFLDWLGGDVTPRVIAAAENDREGMAAAALLATRELAAGGVGTVAESFFDACGARALAEVGLRGIFFRELFGSRADDLDDYLARSEARIADDLAAPRSPLIGYGLAPHAPYTVPLVVLRAAVARARREGLRLSIHLAESAEEARFFRTGDGPMRALFAPGERLARYAIGRGPALMLADQGLLGPETILVHGVQLDADEIEALAASGAGLVHCPSSNANLAVGIAPIEELLEAGVTVALGTDSPASTAKLDLFEEMRLAIALQRLRHGRPGRLDAACALEMATLAGARLLGLDDRIGSLEIGKDADLAVVALDRPVQRSLRDPVAALVLASTPADVRALLVAGRAIEVPA